MEAFYQTMRPRFPFGPAAGVEVKIRVEPLPTYVSDYDRVFDIRTAIEDDDDLDDSDFPYWDTNEVFDPLADDHLDDLCEEHADDLADRGLFAPGGLLAERDELRDRMRAFRAAQITGIQNKRLLGGQRLGPSDRPGPPSPTTAALKALFPDLVSSEGWYEAPISALLPLPPTSPGPQKWKSVVVEAFTRHRSKWRMLNARFAAPVALDIAVGGASKNLADLDNLAREILEPFERIYCSRRRGTVVSYRVYETHGQYEGIRVMVMGDDRLAAFEQTLSDARHLVLRRGPQALSDRH
jgi:hypothetical protein